MGMKMASRDNCRFSSIAHYKMTPTRFQKGLEGLETEAISRTGYGLRRLGYLSFRGLQWAVRKLQEKSPRSYAALVTWLEQKGYLKEEHEGHPAAPRPLRATGTHRLIADRHAAKRPRPSTDAGGAPAEDQLTLL